MKTANPFQIPSCLQRADLRQRRQERFKKTVGITVSAVAALLVVLLIEGCMTEQAKSSGTSKTSVATAAKMPSIQEIPATMSVPVVIAQPKSVTAPTVAPETLKVVTPAVIRSTETVYVVKPGDTLSRIAKLHQTTVKTIKAVNGLNSDIIAVGAKLKLPTA
jgi:LysM repeat protein